MKGQNQETGDSDYGLMFALAKDIEEALIMILQKQLKMDQEKNLDKGKDIQNLIEEYKTFVKFLKCHKTSQNSCVQTDFAYEVYPRLYHDLSLNPEIIDYPEGFLEWGAY